MNWIAKLNGWAVPMADNTTLDAGSGGDVIRTEDKAGAGIKTPVSLIDVAGTGSENLVEDGVQGMPTEGVAAENAAVVGNPVLTGGRFDSTPRTLGDGDVGAIAVDATGKPLVVESSAAAAAASLAVIDDWDESDRAKVNPIAGQAGVAAGAGAVDALTQRTTLASDDPAVALLGTIDADTSSLAGCVGGTELQVDIVASATLTVDLGANNDVVQSTHDNFNCNANVQQGNADVGSGNPLQVTLANGTVPSHAVTNAGTFATQATLTPATSGGLDTFKSTDIDETEEDVKTSAGLLYWIYCVNTNASARYLKVYNATAASVTVGSTATKLDLLIPPSNSGFYIQFPHGVTFSTAISVAATTGVGDADSGAPGANEVQVTIGYK